MSEIHANLSRREFLALLAITSGAGILGCSDSTGSPPPPAPVPGSIDHIIVVTMENRSFDHLLGWLPGADGRQAGLSYVDRTGISRSTHRLTDFQGCGFADPDHSYSGGRVEYNNGACDGWLRAGANDVYAIGYYIASDLPFLGQAAPQWTVLDRYFTPMMGPTFPNRVRSLAGQTDRIENTLVASTLPAIWDRLSGAGLTGRNYGAGLVSSSMWGTRYASLIHPITRFFGDSAAGTLPNVAFVDPDFSDAYSNSYHPPGDIRNAEAFLGSISGCSQQGLRSVSRCVMGFAREPTAESRVPEQHRQRVCRCARRKFRRRERGRIHRSTARDPRTLRDRSRAQG